MENELTFLHLFVAIFAWARLASPTRASTLNAITGMKDVMNKSVVTEKKERATEHLLREKCR